MQQTDKEKLARSKKIIAQLKEARGGKVMASHRVMGNDPNLINAFLQQYIYMTTEVNPGVVVY